MASDARSAGRPLFAARIAVVHASRAATYWASASSSDWGRARRCDSGVCGVESTGTGTALVGVAVLRGVLGAAAFAALSSAEGVRRVTHGPPASRQPARRAAHAVDR